MGYCEAVHSFPCRSVSSKQKLRREKWWWSSYTETTAYDPVSCCRGTLSWSDIQLDSEAAGYVARLQGRQWRSRVWLQAADCEEKAQAMKGVRRRAFMSAGFRVEKKRGHVHQSGMSVTSSNNNSRKCTSTASKGLPWLLHSTSCQLPTKTE